MKTVPAALPLILLACITSNRLISADIDASVGCPGYKSDGEHYFVTDKSQLHGCVYSFGGKLPKPPTVDRIAEFECKDRTHHKDCWGYLINPYYAFWDDEKKEYFDPPECPHQIPSCQDMDDVCVDGGDRECDDFHHYVCQSKDLTKTVVDFNQTRQENVWCKGKVTAVTHYKCPPRHVSSWEEVTSFCTREAYRINATHYKCDYYNAEVCSGTIDPSIPLPQCTKSANDCHKADKSPVCKRNVSPVQQDFCGARFDYHDNGSWTYRGNFLECSDRQHHSWCITEMDPEVTKEYIKDETCPLDSLDYCRDIHKLFKRPWFCHCIQDDTGEDVAFSCHHDGKAEPWCQGLIEKPQFDEHLRLIPKEHHTAEDLGTSDKGISTSGGKAGVSILVLGVVAVALVLMLRRRASAKVPIEQSYGDDNELELQASSKYTDSPSDDDEDVAGDDDDDDDDDDEEEERARPAFV